MKKLKHEIDGLNKYQRFYKLHKEEKKIQYQKKRMIVLEYYGGRPPKCACCGEKETKFLALDHINGGGTRERKSTKGRNIIFNVIRDNFPTGFQILCHNCNCAKGFYGKCPHKSNDIIN